MTVRARHAHPPPPLLSRPTTATPLTDSDQPPRRLEGLSGLLKPTAKYCVHGGVWRLGTVFMVNKLSNPSPPPLPRALAGRAAPTQRTRCTVVGETSPPPQLCQRGTCCFISVTFSRLAR
ncbi:unnamed protein product, partial [Iphiclides podalirius]